MSEKMLKQVKPSSYPPARSKSTRQNPVRRDLLQLQHLIGNSGTRQLLKSTAGQSTQVSREILQRTIASQTSHAIIQRDEYDDPNDFMAWFKKHEVYTKSLSNNGGDCAPSAKAIGAFLEGMFKGRDVTVAYRAISFLTPFGHPAASNMPHFVITVTWGETTVVIDPTQEQFAGGKNQIADQAAWEAGFAGLPTTFSDPEFKQIPAVTPKIYDDFKTFDEANKFIVANRYKTTDEDEPVGKQRIGEWKYPRVPFVRAPKVAVGGAGDGTLKDKKGLFSSMFGKKNK